MKKIAFILLTPGHKDGIEITEAVSARIALSELNTHVTYFSFNEDFATEDQCSKRNALKESQRLSRGHSLPIDQLNPTHFDALVLPGGFGMLKNLSSWVTEQENFEIHPALQEIVLHFHQQSKPIGAICITPFLVGNILKKYKPLITLGETSDLTPRLQKMNIQHETCPSDDYITDRDCKILSTPAYMNETASPFQVYTGIRLMLKELVEMA